jgi:lincosamide nucleotidyltransferase A/C/D/E
MSVLAERGRRFIKSRPALRNTAEHLWRLVEALPAPLRPVLEPVKGMVLREMTQREVLLVIDRLESVGVSYFVAGGWGIDLLVGRQTRRHKDLDVIIEGFDENEPKVRAALLALGFRHVDMDTGGIWMPSRSNFEDRAGHRIEILNIDWERVAIVLGAADERPDALGSRGLAREVFTSGTMNGRVVPCLTAKAQMVFHTGFHLEATGVNDMSLLQTTLESLNANSRSKERRKTIERRDEPETDAPTALRSQTKD